MTPPERPLRVLHLAAVAFTAEKLLLPQLQHLAAAGYDVRLACAPDADGYPEALLPFAPEDVRFPRSPRPLATLRAVVALLRLVWRTQPDVLHLHTPAAALPARGLPRRLYPRRTRIVFTVHGYAHTWNSARKDRVLAAVERVLAPRADVTLYQSGEDLREARARGFRGRLILLGNGVEQEWFDLPLPQRAGELRVLFVGRLVAEKGVLELLEAVDRCDGVHLTVVGAQLDSDRDGVEADVRSRAAASDRIAVLGMLSRAQVREQLTAVDVIALPSHREGVPRSLIEGMAAGRPALATDIRGCRELVTPCRNGVLVPAGDVAALAQGLETLRDLSATEFAAWSAAARAEMSEGHREEVVFQRLRAAYSAADAS